MQYTILSFGKMQEEHDQDPPPPLDAKAPCRIVQKQIKQKWMAAIQG